VHIHSGFAIIGFTIMNEVQMDHSGSPILLIVDDDPVVVELVGLYAKEAGFGPAVGAGTADEGLAALRNGHFRLVLLDLGLPDRPDGDALQEFMEVAGTIPVVVVTADDRVETAVRCMKSGAFDFMDKPLSPARIMSLLAHAKENIKLRALLEPMNPALRSPAFSRIVTRSPLMLGLFQTIERLGPSPLPVLVYGESGTGKELIARAIHDISGRNGPFVPVNVAGLDGSLFSDVLFGHAKGAYTGADGARPGLVRRAEGGTLFMDEIGDISPESQVKLLRFLQDGEYYPLGSDKPERSACRVVLATHVDLAEAVKAGRFRADLYYRLMIHIVTIPPLRDRKEDIPLLVEHFSRQAAEHLKRPPPPADPAFITALDSYSFPGNIRELSAVVYGAAADSGTGRPSIGYVRDYVARQRADTVMDTKESCIDYPYVTGDRFPSLDQLELQHIREALRRSGGNQSAAAVLLGISQSTISRRLKQLSGK
jgi:DNA-binding NtrC family response regulator